MRHRGNTSSILCVVAAFAICFPACYTYQSVHSISNENLLESRDQDLKVIMRDGSTVEIAAKHYIVVRDSESFIYGTGRIVRDGDVTNEEFEGRLRPELESKGSSFVASSGWGAGQKVNWIEVPYKHGTRVHLVDGEYALVDSNTVPSLWYWKQEISRKGIQGKTGKIPLENVLSVEVHRINMYATVPLTALAIGFSGIALMAVIGGSIITWH